MGSKTVFELLSSLLAGVVVIDLMIDLSGEEAYQLGYYRVNVFSPVNKILVPAAVAAMALCASHRVWTAPTTRAVLALGVLLSGAPYLALVVDPAKASAALMNLPQDHDAFVEAMNVVRTGHCVLLVLLGMGLSLSLSEPDARFDHSKSKSN